MTKRDKWSLYAAAALMREAWPREAAALADDMLALEEERFRGNGEDVGSVEDRLADIDASIQKVSDNIDYWGRSR